jgi:TRAP-type mannitol/chloroaromatic compound transport system substrate-binding protein
MTMKRRDILTGGTLAAAAASTLAAPAIAQSMPQVAWRLTSSFPKSLDTIYGTAVTFAKAISDATDGRFQIQTFPAGELIPPLQALDAVQTGAVECAQTPTYFYYGKDPTLAIGTGLPFGVNARLQNAWWTFNGGGDLVNQALARFNCLGLPMGNSGCQMGGWFRKEINTVDDLKGLKFRIGGIGGQVLARLGVVPQQIGGGDVYPALERGTIDAAEFVGPYDDEKLGLQRVAKYYYYPGFWEGGAMLHLVINLEQWNKLPKPYQAIVRQAAEYANNWMISKYDSVNAPALKRLVAGGTELRAFPIPVMDAAWDAANALYAELSAKDPLFKQAYESLAAFRNEQYQWWQIGEHFFDAYQIRQRGKG